MRLFIGIPVPPGPAFAQAGDELAKIPGCRLVPAGSWHITLRFLGDVDDVAEIAAALTKVLKGQRALQAVIESVGTFPPNFPPDSKARVVWAGVRADGLESLARAVQEATKQFGEPVDRQAFVGHVTLARFSKATDVRQFAEDHRRTLFSKGDLNQVVLFQSDAGPRGTRHEALQTWRLGEA